MANLSLNQTSGMWGGLSGILGDSWTASTFQSQSNRDTNHKRGGEGDKRVFSMRLHHHPVERIQSNGRFGNNHFHHRWVFHESSQSATIVRTGPSVTQEPWVETKSSRAVRETRYTNWSPMRNVIHVQMCLDVHSRYSKLFFLKPSWQHSAASFPIWHLELMSKSSVLVSENILCLRICQSNAF